MIYNLAIGLTSPAYHCLLDTDFTMVSNDGNADPTAAQIENLDSVIQSLIYGITLTNTPSMTLLNQNINRVLLFQPIVKHVYPDMYMMATNTIEHALQQKLMNL
jgi:hypothetical protein